MTARADEPSSALMPLYRDAERWFGAREFKRAHQLCLRILAQDPTFTDGFVLLAKIAAEHSNFGKALDVLDRAVKIAPDRADYHALRSRFLVTLHRPREAIESARTALALHPADALTFDTLGVVLTRCGAEIEAVEPFQHAVALDPTNAAFRYNFGTSLQFAGRFEEAEAAFRATLQLQPAHPRAWSALASLKRKPFRPAEVAAIETLLASDRLDVDGELNLRHALAKQLEDDGQPELSLDQLERGKHRKREAIRYAPEADRQLFDSIRQLCDSAFIGTKDGDLSDEPIFIVGMPRTGTTLLERILGSHPDVFAAGELSHFSLAAKRLSRSPTAYVLDAPTIAALRTIDHAALGRSYIDSTRPRTGHSPRFTDKMPLNFLYAGVIHRALPNARILCLRRHPLDTCISNYRQLFSTRFGYYNYAYDLLDTGRYYALFDSLVAHWRAILPPDRFTEVHYEDLVEHTEREARRVSAFCNLDYRPQMLEFHRSAAAVSTASSVQVRQPIYRDSLARWRRYGSRLQPLIDLLRAHGVRVD